MEDCTNETLLLGKCYGLPVCGFCYDFGQFHRPSRHYEVYNLVVIGVALPVLGLLGFFGNSISAFIYSRKCMRVSLNIYLCALAMSDITIISTSFFLFFLESMRKRSAFVSKYFALMAPIMFPLGLTAQTLSVFLTLTAAFDCFILVVGSDRFRRNICSVRTSKWIVALDVILSCAFNFPHLFEISVVNCWSIPYEMESYDVCPTALRQDETYFTLYYAYGYTIVMAVGPVLILIILNTIIVVALRSYSKGAKVPTITTSDDNNNDGANTPADDGTKTDVITLVLVVCLFISCNILPLSVNFLELLFNIVNSYLIDLSNLMVVLNSSCNFLIYYAFGRQFRRTLQQYIQQYFTQNRKKLKICYETATSVTMQDPNTIVYKTCRKSRSDYNIANDQHSSVSKFENRSLASKTHRSLTLPISSKNNTHSVPEISV
ncbi:7 transmembrane receptor (rhodopsin family) domain-containing protein [Ditylenchus destructor]|uniref:7 transmembrane receptor (Rhodopsin family) domain-containing protein n=1 Tax=Ditylenchus destructor TaxID=166010 RepID=A0AAD4N377_9BILA|nr:7 transmembrane receptor (rhodopsin family) domain-containing protein [Ditylenchus destructor]